jgi:RNA-binding protein
MAGVMSLTSRQRAQLRSLAHHLKPVHTIGKEGLTDANLRSIAEVFNHRELIKVKVQESSPESAREAGALIEQRLAGVHHVQTIGRTLVLYRRHPETPEIPLAE